MDALMTVAVGTEEPAHRYFVTSSRHVRKPPILGRAASAACFIEVEPGSHGHDGTCLVAGESSLCPIEQETAAMEAEILALGRDAPRAPTEVEFCEIFALSYRRLVVQLYGVTGDSAEAEDLVQEAFVRAAAAGKRFLVMDNPEAWVRTVAINIQRSRWRKLRNFSRIRDRLAAAPSDLPALEDRLDVIKAMRTLPEGQRVVVALHYLADLGVAEVAGTLGIAEGTVKSRLSRGREALALALSEDEGDRTAVPRPRR